MIFLLACGNQVAGKISTEKIHRSDTENTHPRTYDSLSVPDFFQKLVNHHLRNFYKRDSNTFFNLCRNNNLNSQDSSVLSTFYHFHILHLLFTSSGASNGAKGEILNIPYLWHWVKPNPRHAIQLAANGKFLSTVPPPPGFGKYASFADIDRIPSLFFKDWFAPNPQYVMNSDTFSTFGWCSEREMAFVCLMSIYGYNGKIVVQGNHSWSEFMVPLKNKANETVHFHVRVDNTFDSVEWNKAEKSEVSGFKETYSGKGLKTWYNLKAGSENEKTAVKKIIVPATVSSSMENSIIRFLGS